MYSSLIRLFSIIVCIAFVSACAKAPTTHALNIHDVEDPESIRIQESQIYTIKLKDASEHRAVGNAIRINGDYVFAYDYRTEQWKRYHKSEIDNIYLVVDDSEKAEKREYWKTGLAVIAAFAAATAGGYFIQKEVR